MSPDLPLAKNLSVLLLWVATQWSHYLLAGDTFHVHDLGLGHLVDRTPMDIHMIPTMDEVDIRTILIIDEVDILTLLIIMEDVRTTIAVIMTTTILRIAVDGEGRIMATREHHRDEARDIETMIIAVRPAVDAPIRPLPHVRRKETEAGEMILPLVADGQVTQVITHQLREVPLNCQKRILAITSPAITHLAVAMVHLVIAVAHLVLAITYLVMVSLILRGHQLSSGLTNQKDRTNHPVGR